ncbi:GGDEF domain-containing protein [Paenibacillus sp. FJAT-27812]|uniref:GGDEF domain-containing protein n=1 Tax=Paenibacillus sp. FJAT-27812 TaxID=1684143 RepID=UPI0006A7C9F5|nr:GGDEF domain-containing protein [Paenibacillus sp. FJAT-27812]
MSSLRIIKEIKKNKISLATLLTGLVSISVLLTLTILLIASYHSKKKSLYETTLTLNLSNASKMSQTMDSLFKSMRSSLKNAADFYAANPSLHAEDTQSHLNLIRTSSTYFNSIALVDSSGLILAVSPSSIGTAGERILTDAAKEVLLLLLVTIALARRLASPFETLANIVGNIGQKEERRPDLKQHWNREADLLNKAVVLAFDGIKLQTDQLTQAAMTDALTGLSNRRTMESRMKQWTEELKPYAIILLDIDRFKLINDTFGHQEGDKVLQHLANIVKSTARPGDLCSRYGGEEFVVLLPSATVSDAYDISERIRTTMESSESHLKQKVTISLGVAQFPLQSGNADELFVLADQALYKAKHAGRNRTMIAEGTRNEKEHSG